jgi:tetratricopeptide (TPR) repeat protein
MKTLTRLLSCLLLALLSTGSLQAKEGFGILKKMVTLRRTNPPEVLITGTRIQAVGKGQGQNKQDIAAQIATRLGSELVQHDPRLTLDAQRPQTTIEVTVLHNSFETKWENRRGTRLDPVGKDNKGKMQYREVEVTLHFQVVNHRFGASYTVQEGAKKTLFADSLDISFHQDFQDGHGAPTEADLVGSAVQQTVGQIVYKLTPTDEALQVLVPKGSFEQFINLAEAGLWSRYSETIEARPALPNPMDEAYRQYALGLAYEALGYGADGTETTLRYLEQAAQHYNSALSLNPKEDYFSKAYEGSFLSTVGKSSLNVLRGAGGQAPIDTSRRQAQAPLQRVQAAMKKYQTLLSQNEIRSAKAVETGAKALGGGTSASAPQGMTNGDVISMIKSGVPEEIVLNAIENAEECAFNTSPAGLIELTKAKVGKEILKRIQAKTCG